MPFGDGRRSPVQTSSVINSAFATSILSSSASGTIYREAGQPQDQVPLPALGSLPSSGLFGHETVHRTDFAAPKLVDGQHRPRHQHRQQSSLPGGEWASDVGRYGLTSASAPHTFPTTSCTAPTPAGPIPRPSASSLGDSEQKRPTVLLAKRPSDEDAATSEWSPQKKPRTRLAAPSDIDLSGVPKTPTTASAVAHHKREGVISPLFFSNSPNPMSDRAPVLPPSDSAAALLARLREDAEGVHTVKLTRGHVHSTSPAPSGSTSGSGSWTSTETPASTSRSPNSQPLPPGHRVLKGIGVTELLEQDERPTFIVDLANPINANKPALHLMHANASLKSSRRVLELLSVDGEQAIQNREYSEFKTWLLSGAGNNESLDVRLPPHSYGGITWTCLTMRKRFRFVSASAGAVSAGSPSSTDRPAEESVVQVERSRGPTPPPGQSDTLPMVDEPDYFGNVNTPPPALPVAPIDNIVADVDGERHHSDEFTNQVLQATLVKPSFDWTRISLTPDISPHVMLARNTDWAATPLGPIEDWSPDLRSMANMVMGSPHPAAMYWGPEFVAIYNEAYIEIAGKKHPNLMGQRYQDGWSEIWDMVAPTIQSAWESGHSTMKNDNQLFINRHGFLEESFFSWSLVPLVGSEGQVVGIYNPAFENTRRKVNERRMLTLREVDEKTAAARDVGSFWPRVKQGLEFNDLDVPFALVYSVREDSESEMSSIHSGSASHPPQVQLEGSIGVPAGHRAAAPVLDLRSSDQGFAEYMRQTMSKHGAPVVLSAEDGSLPADLVEGFDWRGFGEPTRTVVVLPVHPTTAGDSVVGFIVMGTNPRRPYDDDYKLFVHLLSRQLATSLASVVLFEEEIKRGQRAAKLAALDREELRTELILRTKEAVESEYKFTRMAEFAPVGMFIANGQGMINFANDTWWQISRHPREEEDSINSWMNSIRDQDRPGVERIWSQLLRDKEAITHEFRFKCSRQNGDQTIETWVLMSAFPEKDDGGELKSIFGCITDISTQKWAEAFQMQRRDEAVELKRQQENFIDITSHEMRNPLSAILQLADEITNLINDHRNRDEDPDPQLPGLLDRCLEAASTINLCASHQHRIVDDILTLSKLDSQLVVVTPVDVQPVTIVQNVLKMFESEVHTHDIALDFDVSQQFVDQEIDWVKLDPSRLRQVLINLMTNAVKFTQTMENRRISVSVTASRDVSEIQESASYFPSRRDDAGSLTKNRDWGSGEEVNLHFSVKDTGPGMQEHEKKLLFQRFSQTSPRTHVQYGGSGLGLFISRMLTELQGGQIGVVSEKGQGSTFSFYVKCRKVDVSSAKTASAAVAAGLNPTAAARPTRAGRIPTSTTPSPARLPQSRRTSAAQATTPTEAPKPPGHDVLIVEDNLVNQRVLQRQLRNCGNNTHVANHGGEAIDALKRSRFWSGYEMDGYHLSVILMDLEMPVMDGMTCARRIRQLEKDGMLIRHIPIIAVTAYARPEQIASAKAAGIDDVISKPYRIPELSAKIDELITRYGRLTTDDIPSEEMAVDG